MPVDAKTVLYAVFGDPVSHSLSPVMHNRAFDAVGVNGVYLAFRVREIGRAIEAMRALDIRGASITIPHKVAALPFLDHLDPLAEKIGAVNTILNRDGHLEGYNSDGLGAVTALREKTAIRGKTVAILGAGGAARAIAFAIRSEGAFPIILNRSHENGKRLAADLDAEFCPLDAFPSRAFDIVINTTPVGMSPKTDASPVKPGHLASEMVVMDIVYTPTRTRLLKNAEQIGCTIIEGLSMFISQGAFQFELWTGKKAPLDVMKQTVLEHLTEKRS